jgi:hypothetical protein
MSIPLTKEQASKVGGLTAGIGLAVAILGAVLVEPVVIGVGALGVAAAALVKLNANTPAHSDYTPEKHPMRRAEDRNRNKVGV